ncbi:MAG: hypothetical protein R3360_04385, partial [Alphaproteobacteria bacterium]|nr:hypothetical protein [Alphaproteobacteria bacterium]
EQLWAHAAHHQAERPLYHALDLASTMLEEPAAQTLVAGLGPDKKPGPAARGMMTTLAPWALLPDPESGRRRGNAARFALYLRSHWLRMPPGLLARHLATKTVMGWRDRWSAFRARQSQGPAEG